MYRTPPSIRTRRLASLMTALLALTAAPGAQALQVDVDFNARGSATYSGAAVVGAAGDFWNGVLGGSLGVGTTGTNLPLKDAGGAATGLTLSYTQTRGAFDSTGGCLMDAAASAALMCDYIYVFGADPAVTVTIAGLTAGEDYDLILYSSANARERKTDFTLGGSTQRVTAASAPITDFVLGTNYTRFTGTVGAGGDLAFTMSAPRGSEANLDGLQLTLSPARVSEPASTALVLAGFALIGAGRRRGRQAQA